MGNDGLCVDLIKEMAEERNDMKEQVNRGNEVKQTKKGNNCIKEPNK